MGVPGRGGGGHIKFRGSLPRSANIVLQPKLHHQILSHLAANTDEDTHGNCAKNIMSPLIGGTALNV